MKSITIFGKISNAPPVPRESIEDILKKTSSPGSMTREEFSKFVTASITPSDVNELIRGVDELVRCHLIISLKCATLTWSREVLITRVHSGERVVIYQGTF